QRQSLPPVCTHNMLDDATDPILTTIRRVGLFNSSSDRVKVAPGGGHGGRTWGAPPGDPLGTPWDPLGQPVPPPRSSSTPSSCPRPAPSCPSTTRSSSGAATWGSSPPTTSRIYIVDRRFRGPDESCAQLTAFLYGFCRLSRRQRILQRNRTERLAELLDWKYLAR
ncbi:GYS2 protein, partial [Eudromia elegans]|nr:GYS2 protein [Eudromia elegans]